jgi:hypothetical protein
VAEVDDILCHFLSDPRIQVPQLIRNYWFLAWNDRRINEVSEMSAFRFEKLARVLLLLSVAAILVTGAAGQSPTCTNPGSTPNPCSYAAANCSQDGLIPYLTQHYCVFANIPGLSIFFMVLALDRSVL